VASSGRERALAHHSGHLDPALAGSAKAVYAGEKGGEELFSLPLSFPFPSPFLPLSHIIGCRALGCSSFAEEAADGQVFVKQRPVYAVAAG